MIVFQVLGLLLILASISGAFWWITRHTKATGAVITAVLALCLFAVFSGVALILEERITKVIIPKVGTIEAVTQQATTDAKTISDLKARVENQSATVDLVAKQASSAKALSEQVEEQNKLAAQKLCRALSERAALEYAGRNFTLLTDLKIKPLAVDYLAQWWKEHREESASK
jgi:hypothetical protein